MPVHGVGITLFYHRWSSHRSFKCPEWLSNLGIFLGYLAFSGSPIGWAAKHRIHHQNVDDDYDPHSPVRKGIFHAFIGWIFVRDLTEEDLRRIAPDLFKHKFLVWLGVDTFPAKPIMNVVIALSFRLLLFVLFGPNVAIASLLAGLIIFTSPLILNVVCHLPYFGYRRFKTNDESRNVMWLLPITYGESLHNAHHWKPRRASTSNVWWELDPTYWVLLVLERLGLAWDIKR